MSKGLEMATITCAECGLAGRLEREEGRNVTSAFMDNDEFRRLYKSPAPGFVPDCPHWDEAYRAAIPHLKAQTKH